MDIKEGPRTTPGWAYNELRTLRIELDVFRKFKEDFGVSGATIAENAKKEAGETVTAEMLAGERNAQMATIGTPPRPRPSPIGPRCGENGFECPPRNVVGRIDMEGYGEWLQANYGITLQSAPAP